MLCELILFFILFLMKFWTLVLLNVCGKMEKKTSIIAGNAIGPCGQVSDCTPETCHSGGAVSSKRTLSNLFLKMYQEISSIL